MRSVAAGIVLLALSAPAQVLACPVCSPGRDDATQQAFFNMTIFMTLLPLAMFGLVIFWFVRRIRAAEAAEEQGGHDQLRPELAPTSEE